MKCERDALRVGEPKVTVEKERERSMKGIYFIHEVEHKYTKTIILAKKQRLKSESEFSESVKAKVTVAKE